MVVYLLASLSENDRLWSRWFKSPAGQTFPENLHNKDIIPAALFAIHHVHKLKFIFILPSTLSDGTLVGLRNVCGDQKT